MSYDRDAFSKRVNRVTRKHRAMAHGYSARLRGDGLIVVQPRRIQFKMPVRGFVLLMLIFMFFKGFMMASLGEAAYQSRLTILSGGTIYEQAGAFVMGIDPVSKGIAQLFEL